MSGEPENLYVASRQDWRNWLEANHATRLSVWLVQYKKHTGIQTLTWSEAVDEALCFGWIDSTRRPIDQEKFMQFFSRRKPKSTWSKINKDKIEVLTAQGLMAPAGLECIAVAKLNGAWGILDDVDALIVPPDLEAAFAADPGVLAYYMGLSRSNKWGLLHRLKMAKQSETRQKRIAEIVELAANNQKPDPFGLNKKK